MVMVESMAECLDQSMCVGRYQVQPSSGVAYFSLLILFEVELDDLLFLIIVQRL